LPDSAKYRTGLFLYSVAAKKLIIAITVTELLKNVTG
jgi:hypothetical protein